MNLSFQLVLLAGLDLGLLFPILIVGVLYFFFLRPQRKKQDAQTTFVQELKKGDKVVTSSGVVGQISKIDNKTVQLQLEGKNFITFVTGAISKEMTDSYHAPENTK